MLNISDYFTKHQKEREELIRLVRCYGLVMVPAIIAGSLLVVLNFFLLAWWLGHRGWGLLGFLAVLIIGVMVIIRAVYVWSLNAMLITNQRIMYIQQQGFFHRTVSEITYDKIQDVRSVVHGLWSTLFHFGSVVIQTAGSSASLEMSGLKDPSDLQQLISDTQRDQVATAPAEVTPVEVARVLKHLQGQISEEEWEHLVRKTHRDASP